ncbi:uncharacterized protein LOC126898772 [Daktulosphaira vitifoliae]|uniref:uncharacterized protein LOC126898772 n=1 Tax=Daktulosphaira vitifoliae TaxID=58002 RepID=UPI0021AACFC9|nr:uncharacterized protein LOC126898772 [Daktulosphaira vitifoliae]
MIFSINILCLFHIMISVVLTIQKLASTEDNPLILSKPAKKKRENVNCNIVYNKKLLNDLHIFKTMDKNKDRLTECEIELLTRKFSPYNAKANEKEFALLKYKKKMQSIQCTFGLIVHYLLMHLKKLVTKLRDDDSIDYIKYIYHQYHDRTATIFSKLFSAGITPHSWIWIFYSKLIAVSDWTKNKDIIDNRLFSDYLLNIELLNFLSTCESNMYLSIDLYESLLHSKATRDLSVLTNEIIDPFFNSLSLTWDSNYFEFFITVERMLLLENNLEDVLFEPIRDFPIEWSATKKRLMRLKEKCVEHFNRREWINSPFSCNEYHMMVIDILKVRLLSFTWMHLYINHELSRFLDNSSKTEQLVIDTIKKNVKSTSIKFYSVFVDFVNYLEAKDDTFWDLVKLLNIENDINTDQLYFAVASLFQIIYNSLISLSVNNIYDNMNNNSIMATYEDNVSTTQMKHNVQFLIQHFNIIKYNLKPIDIKFLNFYREGNASFFTTYQMNDYSLKK